MGAVSTPRAPVGASHRAGRAERWALPALVAMLAAGAAVLLYIGHGTGFYYDDWNFVLERRGWTLDALLKPHNEHLSLLPVLVYKLLFATVGVDSYLPYRIAGTALHIAVVGLLFAYARPRVGPWMALACAALLLLFGPGYIDVLWPFQIGYLGSLACGLGALLALDRGGRRAEIAASALITLALCSSSLGIPLLIGFALEVLGHGRRRRLLVAPVVLYGLWYLGYGTGSGITVENVLATPHYVAEAAANAAGALAGLDVNWGRPLVLGLAIASFLALRRVTSVPWRVAALAAAALAFWALTGLTRAQLNEPGAPRYLYPGALFLLLLAMELARGWRPARTALVLTAVLVPLIVISDAGALRTGARVLRDQNAKVRGALAATELAGDRLPAGFAPSPGWAPQVHAGAYRAAVRDLGSPAIAPADLPRAYDASRVAADDVLVRGYRPAPVAAAAAAGAGAAPTVEKAIGATATASGSCLIVRPTGTSSSIAVTVPPSGLSAAGVSGIGLRRWGDEFQPALPMPRGAPAVTLTIPGDGDTTPWHARLAVVAPARICAV